MIDKGKVRERLVSAWEKSGMTQLELSQRAGLSPTQLNGYMRGLYIPTIENMYKICKECGVTLDDVIEGTVTYSRFEL